MSIKVSRVEKPEIVKLVIGELWDNLIDDSDVTKGDFDPRMDDSSRWYSSTETGDVVGVYWLRRINHITWEGHVNIRPKYWGSGLSLPHAQKVLQYMWEDSGAEKIVATIPDESPHVIDFILKLGFNIEGRRTNSYRKGGKTYDEVYFGIQQES
jgi:RimJ/RimL family protein N-acetyltransferase